VLELEPAAIDDPGRERPEHERVVGVRAVSQADAQGQDGNSAGPV
jgi:hypothetical protein